MLEKADRKEKLMSEYLMAVRKFVKILKSPVFLFIVIFAIGGFIRLWKFGQVPPGLHQDEASIGLEAYDLVHYGVDRNGVSFPVNFISWGNGMDALYGYLLMPFMLFGLNPITVRLPSLIAGLLTLPLVFFIASKSFGRTFGLIAMFLLAVSPWHILLSRWGINENIVPFIFCLGYACLLLSSSTNYWFPLAMACFGLSLYAYGALYLAVPVFLLIAIPGLFRSKRVGWRSFLIGLSVFLLLAVPIVLFILVNALGWDSIHLGIFTVPRLPDPARFLDVAVTSKTSPLSSMALNTSQMIKLLLINQSDGLIWNSVGQFGYMYPFSIALAILGLVSLFPLGAADSSTGKRLLLAWLLAALSIGVFQLVNTNRIHLVFIPIILCLAACLTWLGQQRRALLVSMLCVYLFCFGAFIKVYFSSSYLVPARSGFFDGLLPALEFVEHTGSGPVCVTDRVNMPYIFVLFVEKPDPAEYVNNMVYAGQEATFTQVRSLGRYSFGVNQCPAGPQTVYVLSGEKPPEAGTGYQESDFGEYQVYVPK